ncbi:dsDNA nuclease domain-containing protein [Paenibacillus sp. P36]|uniref:dsDNA nuclease domain-containing protein n=1 Tax=Paenibacillus sp. P36 TaxID=3342538 RepID=UPI0038B25B59
MKNYDSGSHDPYWYESYVGLKYVLEMLDTDSGIEAVAFQVRTINKLDDVVVKYKDGRSLCIQVKHTRAENNLTLSDLIRPSSKSSSSLLQDMAVAWQEGLKNVPNCIPELYTNRRGGKNWSRTANDSAYPPLPEFWKALREEMKRAGDLSGIHLDSTYRAAWTDLLTQLGVLKTDINKYEFLRKLRLRFSSPDLEKLESQMHEQIGRIFGVSSSSFQREIFEKLAASLRFWTTSIQGKVDFVYPEDVYSRLSLQVEVDDRDHLIRPPASLFQITVSLYGTINRTTWFSKT